MPTVHTWVPSAPRGRAGSGLQGGAGPGARGAERHGSTGSFSEGPPALGPAGEGGHEVDGAWKASGGV